jgi:hypothetical protein
MHVIIFVNTQIAVFWVQIEFSYQAKTANFLVGGSLRWQLSLVTAEAHS